MSRNRFAGITSRVLMLIAAGLLVMSYLSVLVNPARAWFMTLFGLFFFPLALLNLILLVWAVKRKSRSFLIPLVAFAPALFFAGRYVRIGGSDRQEKIQTEASGENVRIVSYNVGRFSFGRKMQAREACADSVIMFLKGCDADIICLQEFFFKDHDKVKAFLKSRFKDYSSEYYLYIGDDGCFGNVTLSRVPVKAKGRIEFDKSSNLALYTDYIIGGEPIRVYNCHFESYSISLPHLVKSLDRNGREVFRKTEAKVRSSIRRRPAQVDMVLKDIAGCPVESVVCGDFNDNPMSYTYYRMSRGRSDTFVEAGRGFGATYSILWPMLRIDYMLFPDRFRAISHETPRVGFSDHYPIVTEIQM